MGKDLGKEFSVGLQKLLHTLFNFHRISIKYLPLEGCCPV